MLIAGLQRTSTLDFPGKLAAVIFTAGCNYRCFYCHNKPLLDDPPLMSEDEVIAFLEKRRGLLDGIVFSGGEPTLQKDLSWWLNRAKRLGFAVKLDTNGSRPDVLEGLIKAGLADYIAMDVKCPLGMYPSITGAAATGVKRSIELLTSSGVEHEFRTTVVPQLGAKELSAIAESLPSNACWALQLYREQPGDAASLRGLAPYTPGEIHALAENMRPLRSGVFARC